MRIVSITGIAGGVGATTVAAHLASALAARGRPVIVFDFSPQNSLRLHFGMPWEDNGGLVPQLLSGEPWHESAYRCENGVDFIPFGNCNERDIAAFERLLQEPDWLASRLGELDAGDDTILLFDVPRESRGLRMQAHALSDLILAVMASDPLSYAALPKSREDFAPGGAGKVDYLINGFDPTRELDREVAQLLRTGQEVRLCPVTIHRDESVREALASKLSIEAYAPYSQAAGDYAALSTWLAARLAQLQRTAS